MIECASCGLTAYGDAAPLLHCHPAAPTAQLPTPCCLTDCPVPAPFLPFPLAPAGRAAGGEHGAGRGVCAGPRLPLCGNIGQRQRGGGAGFRGTGAQGGFRGRREGEKGGRRSPAGARQRPGGMLWAGRGGEPLPSPAAAGLSTRSCCKPLNPLAMRSPFLPSPPCCGADSGDSQSAGRQQQLLRSESQAASGILVLLMCCWRSPSSGGSCRGRGGPCPSGLHAGCNCIVILAYPFSTAYQLLPVGFPSPLAAPRAAPPGRLPACMPGSSPCCHHTLPFRPTVFNAHSTCKL